MDLPRRHVELPLLRRSKPGEPRLVQVGRGGPVLSPKKDPHRSQQLRESDVQLSRKALEEVLRRYPRFGVTIQEQLTNSTNMVFRVNGDVVARVSRPAIPLARAYSELRILQTLHDADMPVPRPLGGVYPAQGRMVTFYESIDGETDGPYNEQDGELLARLHDFPTRGIRPSNPLFFADNRVIVLENHAKDELTDPAIVAKVHELYAAGEALIRRSRTRRRKRLIHGDMWRANLFHKKTGGSVVTDFESAGAGIVEEEFAQLEHRYSHISQVEAAKLWHDSYRTELLPGYRRAGGPVDEKLVNELKAVFDFNHVLLSLVQGRNDIVPEKNGGLVEPEERRHLNEYWRGEGRRRLSGLYIVDGLLRSDPDVPWVEPTDV